LNCFTIAPLLFPSSSSSSSSSLFSLFSLLLSHICLFSLSLSSADKPVFVAYVTAGFPTREETVPTLLALEQGGATVIEVGVPFSDPLADGPTIQKANQAALDNGVNSLEECLQMVAAARKSGLKVPVVFMGYYNPFLAFGEEMAIKSKGFSSSSLGKDSSLQCRT